MSETAQEEFYSWTPNYFSIKSPETQAYVGNVIGNRSKEDQIQIVLDAGTDQKETMLDESAELISEINERAKKFIDIRSVNKEAMREILLYFGNMFILDASALDSIPLG
jgi:hypothetical protein